MMETSGFGQVRCTHVDSSYKKWACKYIEMLVSVVISLLLVLDFYIICKLLCCITISVYIIMCVLKCLSANVYVNWDDVYSATLRQYLLSMTYYQQSMTYYQ